MKSKAKNLLVKLTSLVLAVFLVLPSQVWAADLLRKDSRKYTANSSIMGLATQTSPDDSKESLAEEADRQTLLKANKATDEIDAYTIEKSATLSKTTKEITYQFIIKSKAQSIESEKKENIYAIFALNNNTDLTDIKVDKVTTLDESGKEIKATYQVENPGIFANDTNISTLGIRSEKQANDLLYYLSAKVDDEAIAKIEKGDYSPIFALDMVLANNEKKAIYENRYALEVNKYTEEAKSDERLLEIKEEEKLEEVEEIKSLIKGEYSPESNGLFATNPATITWTDYILSTDDKEFVYDIDLDKAQETENSEISVEFYEAKENGFILNNSFSQKLPFANSIKLQIPRGQLARITLTTTINKEANAKEFTYNGKILANPDHKEEEVKEESKKEEKGNDDPDPLPEQKEESEDKSKDKEKAESDKKEITLEADPETNEVIVDPDLIKEEKADKNEEEQDYSAIDLNRDSVIKKFQEEDKADPIMEIAINNIASLFNDYNKEAISYDKLLASLKEQSKDIDKEDFRAIATGLLAGVNKDNYKVANIEIDNLLDDIYGKETITEVKGEEKEPESSSIENNSDDNIPTQTIDQNLDLDSLDTKNEADSLSPEDQDKQKALESFDKALDQVKEESKKPQDDDRTLFGNISEGVKGIFGQSNLQKADSELKAALDEGKSLEEIQALLDSFEEKYQLSREEQVTLMEDNNDAIKALIAKDSETNFRPHIFVASELNLDDKKFHVLTRLDTSTETGAIQKGQFFKIQLDKKLTVKEGTKLEPIKYNNQVIANPNYNSRDNTITYTIAKDIPEKIQVPLDIPVDYNTDNITLDEDGTFTVINKISGLGVVDPKALPPQKVDKNGDLAGTINEEGRDDVEKIIDSSVGDPYTFDMNVWGDPVIEDGNIVGFNWSVKINSDKDLQNELDMKLNLTTVKGSGLGEIKNVKLNGNDLELDNNDIKDKLGIVDSKHHAIGQNTNSANYTFYTPVENKQGSYMLDVSVFLSKKDKKGAVRSVIDQGYPQDKIEELTPTRVGINNRTTIQGKFLANDKAEWTITDAISSGDEGNGGMPLEDRTINGEQTITSGKSAVYGLDAEGKMVQIGTTNENLSEIPSKKSDPSGNQAIGNIAVYEFDTSLKEPDQPNNYNISGVRISKFKDIDVFQEWNLPVDGMTMPSQDFIAKDNAGNEIGRLHVEEGTAGDNKRYVTIPNVRYWDIDGTTHEASKRENNIEQKFDKDTVEYNSKTYKYNENANYYLSNKKYQYIHDSAIPQTVLHPVTFTIVKVDSKDPTKKLAGATFKLLGDENPSIVTDSKGKATFSNVLPGTYTLVEEKAPLGYKNDQANKTITISEDGKISVNGRNIQAGGSTSETKLVQHDSSPNWPDYMNAMHYGKINDSGELEFYLYLKPQSDNGGNGTNRNTRLNISIPGVDITDVTAYDVSPGYRQYVKSAMEGQTANNLQLGNDVINVSHKYTITGTPKKTDAYTGKTGYQIYFPQERFAGDWGFLVKVKANIKDKESVSLDYDWLTNEDTAEQTKLTQSVILNKTNGQVDGEENQILVTNEEFNKSPISVTKFADSFNNEGNRNRLQGAEFVLKDSEENVIANKITDDKGTADFGKYPPGTYRLEEKSAPDGYQKNGVYFEVTVDEQGQVTYIARFEDGIGTPQVGQDYYIEKGEETSGSNKATVTSVNQRLEYLENEPGDIGTKTGVWEAYKYESLKYHADITLSNSAPGSRFEIQFDRNLDFTQYFSEFPKIVIDGDEVADPYFDYDTNLLTYVFNNKSKGGPATASINLRGIIPDKYFAKETGTYNFTIKVAPGVENVGGTPVLNQEIKADYDRHHTESGDSNQSYYFRDVYQKEDGKWYVTVLTYLNPLGFDYSAKTVRYNWITTDFQSNRIAEWSGKGYKPLYELNDVKVYGTDYAKYWLGDLPLNRYMPLSMGIRPEQEPNIYHLLAHQSINPIKKSEKNQNGVYINYNPSQISTSEKLNAKAPLIVKTPKPINKGGYVVEQTFKITDIEQFNTKWRAFYMNDGNLTSAFASRANVNTAVGDQAGGEIPKYYREIVGLINNKYKPGSFKLTKYDETNQGKKLPNATFALTDENGKKIYRTSDQNGVVSFEGIAPGRYSLEETKAPEGYRLTNKKWEVTVLGDGSVRIRETSITGESKLYTNATESINIQVSNKPIGEKFRVYKKDGDGRPLAGAKFKITDPDDPNFSDEATSKSNGLVEFNANLEAGKNYVLEEVTPPAGYNPLNKKWVLRVEDGKTKVYNYSESTEIGDVEKSLLGEDGTEWVDVKDRNTTGWSNYDNRWTGWAGNSQNAEHLGTRIIAINKKEKYVVQRYVINPEARQTAGVDGVTSATIHREKPEYKNMDWYKGDEDIKIFTLEAKEDGNTDGKVTGLISDLRLAPYKVTNITKKVKKSVNDSHYGEKRLKLDLPETDKPIVIDVKLPYKDENGGVGTGMDWRESGTTYWKSDYYERVSDIKTAGLVSETGGTIVGSYVGEDSLDVTNSLKTYGFKIKKVKYGADTTVVPGAVFKLTGPDDSQDERYMTSGEDGMISFEDLKPGKYTLVEEKPAPGYEKPTTTWTIRVTTEGKVYIKDNSPTNNSSFEVSTTGKALTNNLMRRLQMAGLNTELEVGGNLVDTLNLLRAGSNFTIDNPTMTKMYGGTEVITSVTDLGSGKFEIEIHLTNKTDGTRYTGSLFDFKFNDNFTFVPSSTKTWKGLDESEGTKWHTQYLKDENKIGIKSGEPRIARNQTFKIKFQVQAKSNLPAGIYNLIEPISYRHDDKKDVQTIKSPTVTKTGPVITYAEKEVRTEIPIPAEATRIPNDQMYEGEENEKFAGQVGYKVDIYRYKYVDGVEQANPEFVENKKTVEAQPKIIEYGTKKKGPEQRTSNPVTLTEEIPFEIQETVDEDLKPGEVIVDTKGQEGSVQYKYSITYEKSEGTSVERPKDWPDNAPVASSQAGERVISYNKIEVEGSRVNPTTQIVRKGPEGPEEGEEEIPSDGFAQITNKQTGLDLKIYKKDTYDRKLEGAIFNIEKTDKNYENPDTVFGVKTGTSNEDGLVEFKDKDGNPIRLQKGYYLIEETAAPLGYRKANAPWKVQVVEENGQLVAKYKGPEETPQSFIEKNENLDIKEANGVKYATKITHIDTESRTFIQRVYIDTRGKNGTVNVQITPKHKREEIDRPMLPPVTIKEGVKTAYRSTYKISGINGNPDQAQMIKILNDYDVSYPDVTVVNTARWRPFDWGFDEDQLNLEPGVYYIDIEGFYDTSIIDRNVTNEVAIDGNFNFTNKEGTALSNEPVLKDPYKLTTEQMPDEDLGKIDIDIEFFDGAREFQQLKNSNGKIVYGFVKDENGKDEASYQDGVVTLRQWLEDNYGKAYADNWFATKLPGQKYVNQLSKIVKIGKKDVYQSGRIIPPVTPGEEGYKAPSSTISTSMDISSLYSSNKANTVPQEGLSIENDAERYNITFSKHGKDKDNATEEDITKKRLEGAVFKLEKRVREGIYEEVEGSYVSSAFNGYFGFRGLEPGRYRLVEVQPPKNYKPINGPLLYFSVETVSIVSERITDPRTGENIDIKTVDFYFPGNDTAYKFEDLEMHDPVTNKVIKFKDAKNADLETTKIIDPTDSTKKKEVSLRELSIKFPGEIKDKEGNVIKDTYTLSEIQVTPTSNGYISLEYDKANGVYQYIPEKSTKEEDGLLVDFVTAATAKNMGKIVNEKPGTGEITVEKVDQEGEKIMATDQLPGAKFKLTNKETGKSEEGTVGADGTLKFEGLKIGNYKLEEIESPNGYINNKQVWNFTIGGEGLDPYSGYIARTGQDLSDKITLETTDMKVINPDTENNIPTKEREIHPHFGESMEFTNKFTLAENTKINPGDYFVLHMSDQIDLNGIFEYEIENLDIIADGVGTIAKADYDREKRKITYTFTDYAKTYTLIEFSNKLTAFIDLDVVKQNKDLKVGFRIDKTDTNQYKDIKVVYDLVYGWKDDNNDNAINLASKIVKYNPTTGEFLQYYYINRLGWNSAGPIEFRYFADQDLENVNISVSKVNGDVNQEMPKSYGVDEENQNFELRKSYNYLQQGNYAFLKFNNDIEKSDSYIVKVTGYVDGRDKSDYFSYGYLYKYYNGYCNCAPMYADVFNGIRYFKNESAAKVDINIKVVNPANKIKFKKIDLEGNARPGATFQLYTKDNNGNLNSYGQQKTTVEDGIIEYNKLPKGDYVLKEISAPNGYKMAENPVAEFKVDENGKIFRKEVYKDEKGQEKERYVEEPGVVPIPIVNKKEHKIEFKKIDADNTATALKGAEFKVLYKASKDGIYTDDRKLYQNANGEKLVLMADETAPEGYKPVDKFTTGTDGLLKFKFYEPGYYALIETKAPEGYMTPTEPVYEFRLENGKVQVLKNNVDKVTTKERFIESQVLEVNKENKTFRQRIIIYPIGTVTKQNTYLSIVQNGWTMNNDGQINVVKLPSGSDINNILPGKFTSSSPKITKSNEFRYYLKDFYEKNTDPDLTISQPIVVEFTGTIDEEETRPDITTDLIFKDTKGLKEDNITFMIDTDKDKYQQSAYTDRYDTSIEIKNKKPTYPSTGGTGTKIAFAIIGTAVMLAAIAYFEIFQNDKNRRRSARYKK